MATWPTLADLRRYARLPVDQSEDPVLSDALGAAVDFGDRALGHRWPPDADNLPAGARQACLIHAARLYRRRDSLDGTVGWGDLGAIRVGRTDPDVVALYDQIRPMVFG